jgi:hypothetical protein
MAYNVYLLNGLGIQNSTSGKFLTGEELISINRTLQNNFQRVVTAHDSLPGVTPLGSALVRWLAGTVPILATELLIYLLPFGTTLIKSNGTLMNGQGAPGHDGFTGTIGATTGSEVYLHFTDPTLIANLMFHEAMHNKLALDDPHLHPRDGLASKIVSADTKISDRNIQDMAAALDVRRPQWVPGIGILVRESLRPDSDPMKGIY